MTLQDLYRRLGVPVLALVCVSLPILTGCGTAQRADTSSTTDSTATLPPPPGPLPASAVMAFTWFDQEQGGAVSKDWPKARDAMSALGGHRFSAVFTSMDVERQSNLLVLSLWDDAEAAGRGLHVAEAQLPARGWAKSGLYRRIAADGDMRDSVFRSVVLVLPVTSRSDSAHAVADFDAVNRFMKGQPGYIASALFENAAGDAMYPYVISARWGTREDLQRVGALPEFGDLQKKVAIAGLPTTWLQMNYETVVP